MNLKPSDVLQTRKQDLTTDDGEIDWDGFRSSVELHVDGTVAEFSESVPPISHSESETKIEYEASITQTEQLGRELVNLDNYLQGIWPRNRASLLPFGDDKSFNMDNDSLTLEFSCVPSEVTAAAVQRANEDARHPAYILARWVYLVKEADHVEQATTVESAYENREFVLENLPGDSDPNDRLGGFEY
jgi:hypothetical protein